MPAAARRSPVGFRRAAPRPAPGRRAGPVAAAALLACGGALPRPGAAAGGPCARALLLVAHPDDETLFAGEALLGRVASLPGGCRNVAWHVVCVTNGDVPSRREDLRRALIVARMHGLARELTEEVWDFADCNLPYCEHFHESATGKSFDARLSALFAQKPWDFIVTHNAHGEYHHIQHVGLHRAVLLRLENMKTQQTPQLLVFNPLPELNVSLSVGKRRMVDTYLTGPHVKNPRLLLFEALTKYAEHLVHVENFPRPIFPLGLGYFFGATHQFSLHFQYGWALANGQGKWGDLGDFSANKALPLVEDMLRHVQLGACSAGASGGRYPAVCGALRHCLGAGRGALRALLMRMEAPLGLAGAPGAEAAGDGPGGAGIEGAEASPTPLGALGKAAPRAAGGEGWGAGSASVRVGDGGIGGGGLAGFGIRCLEARAAPLRQFGVVSGWTLRGRARGPQLQLELLAVRPILVGWRQGYRGRTYKVLGSSGPVTVDLAAGVMHVRYGGVPLAVQPNDVAGWGILSVAGNRSVEAQNAVGGESGTVQCLISGCDEAGLCVFDAPMPAYIPSVLQVESVQLELQPRRRAPLRRALAPYAVRGSLDISDYVEEQTSYEELMTLRQRLEHPDLSLFEDKIRLRRELLPQVGVTSTPSIHMSHTDTQVARHLEGRRGFVVKPSHMSESQFVFVVQDGINLLQQAWGHPHPQVTAEQIQEAVNIFMTRTALDWECRALVATQAGIIIEDLVLAEDAEGKLRVDEYKFYVVWGEVVFSENVPFSSGAAMEIARNGQVLTTKVACPPFCVAPCYAEMVLLAERVARSSFTDFLRVDILVQGRCSMLFVSEVELFPASDFSPPLKALVAQRWREGYGV